VVELRAEAASRGLKPSGAGWPGAARPGSGGAGEEERGEKLTRSAPMSAIGEREGDVVGRRNP
jgi:hypothetical protein